MTEVIPMRSVLQTDFGEFELSDSVAEKIAAYPKIRWRNPFVEDEEYVGTDVVDFSHPVLARYMRRVTRHMALEMGYITP
jgi:hypothetical protein